MLGDSEQMEELRRLQVESDEEAQTLRQVADEAGTALHSPCLTVVYRAWALSNCLCGVVRGGAERWMERSRDSLRVIADRRLRR